MAAMSAETEEMRLRTRCSTTLGRDRGRSSLKFVRTSSRPASAAAGHERDEPDHPPRARDRYLSAHREHSSSTAGATYPADLPEIRDGNAGRLSSQRNTSCRRSAVSQNVFAMATSVRWPAGLLVHLAGHTTQLVARDGRSTVGRLLLKRFGPALPERSDRRDPAHRCGNSHGGVTDRNETRVIKPTSRPAHRRLGSLSRSWRNVRAFGGPAVCLHPDSNAGTSIAAAASVFLMAGSGTCRLANFRVVHLRSDR